MQVLGTGDLKIKVTVAATQFSESARKKIEEAGGSIVDVPAKIKWTRAIGKERKAAEEAGKTTEKASSKASSEA